jgi:hypothetical protein
MATNKKITQLDELTPATWADDDVIAIVDISAQETKKIQLSTFRGAVTGVSTLNASTPLTVDSATGDVTISVAIDGGGTINAVFDEDNMASNSPTALATQQSIKAYVDSQVGTVDTLAEILANGNTSGGTNIVVSSGDVITTNTINETTAASGVTIDSLLVKDGGITAAGTSTFAGQTITNLGAVTTADINGGTIDGTVIGGSSAAAGTFTTFTSTGIDDNASSTAITIDSSGNVGIGTASPDSGTPLHVKESSASLGANPAASALLVERSGTVAMTLGTANTGTASIFFGDPESLTSGRVQYDNSNNALQFWADSSERMRIDSGGNVGIGISPGDAKLHVMNLAPTNTVLYLQQDNGGYNTDINLYNANNTTSSTLVSKRTNGDLWLYQSGANNVAVYTNGTERMRIDSAGNVGIGTATPGGNLHVQGAAGNQVRLYLTDGDATGAANSLLISKSGTTSFITDRQASSQLWFGTADTRFCWTFWAMPSSRG